MILAGGKLVDTREQRAVLETLEDSLNRTLCQKPLPMQTVIEAIDKLGKKLAAGCFDALFESLSLPELGHYKSLAIQLLSRQYLEFKIQTELGKAFCPSYTTVPPFSLPSIQVDALPLGVILHIAAGNVDGLPAFSLAEGLLTGNINILKLPQADKGLSLRILQELIAIEPALADYIYVFDTPSSDLGTLQTLAGLSDAIVVWGSDAAVSAVRRFASSGTKLIEWGHKLSFAYISGYQSKEAELDALAKHIVTTKQLLCSSCQTIFLDTDDMEQVYAFCDEFLPYLQRATDAQAGTSIGEVAERTLLSLTEQLQDILQPATVRRDYRGRGCSLIPCQDSELVLSDLFGNCPVKRLPQSQLLATLRKKKSYLQTAGLICEADKRPALAQLLARSGVVRITRAGSMSESFCGEAHDGSYPLQRYIRIVNTEVSE